MPLGGNIIKIIGVLIWEGRQLCLGNRDRRSQQPTGAGGRGLVVGPPAPDALTSPFLAQASFLRPAAVRASHGWGWNSLAGGDRAAPGTLVAPASGCHLPLRKAPARARARASVAHSNDSPLSILLLQASPQAAAGEYDCADENPANGNLNNPKRS